MQRQLEKWSIILLLFFVVILMWSFQNNDAINPSEIRSITLGSYPTELKPITDVIKKIHNRSPQHAPLYYVLLNEWMKVVGIHPIILRLFSLYFTIVTLAIVFRLGCFINKSSGGLLALFFAVFSAYHFFYSHEIRTYATLAFSSALVMWMYWRVIISMNHSYYAKLIGLYLASVLCLYTHYFGIFVLLGIGAYHLLFVTKNRRWFQVVLVEVIVGVTFLPWLPVVIKGTSTRKVLESDWQSSIDMIYRYLFIYSNGLWLILLALIFLALYRFWKVRHSTKIEQYVVVVGLVMLISMFALNEVSIVTPARRMRYTIVWLPQIILISTVGILTLSKWRWLQFAVGAIWVIGFVWFTQSSELSVFTNLKEREWLLPYHTILDYKDRLPPDDKAQLVGLSSQTIENRVAVYYSILLNRKVIHLTEMDVNHDDKIDIETEQKELISEVRQTSRFWLLVKPSDMNVEQSRVLETIVAGRFHACATLVDTNDLQLIYFIEYDLACELMTSIHPQIVYDNGLKLHRILIEKVDDELIIDTRWRDKPTEPYGFSIQLFDEDNEKVAQGDYLLPSGMIQTSKLSIDDVSDSVYQVGIVVYDLETYDSLSGTLSTTDEPFDRIAIIADITISDD